MKPKMIVVYSTFSSYEEFERIAETLISEKLIACANGFQNMKSIYIWEDKIKKETEVAGLFKSTKENYKAIEKRIVEMHSYENPCIYRYCIKKPNKKYFKWLQDVVSQ